MPKYYNPIDLLTPGKQPPKDTKTVEVLARARLVRKEDKPVDVKISVLPAVVIFVHGVNSEGEWYALAEQKLCDGLNKRLNRM